MLDKLYSIGSSQMNTYEFIIIIFKFHYCETSESDFHIVLMKMNSLVTHTVITNIL